MSDYHEKIDIHEEAINALEKVRSLKEFEKKIFTVESNLTTIKKALAEKS